MTPFFGSLPTQGIWTAVGLSRAQFASAVAIATLLFTVIGGPVWQHTHGNHLARLTLSYAIIPPLVAIALKRNRSFTWGHLFGATLLVSMIKLVLTAVILIAAAVVK